MKESAYIELETCRYALDSVVWHRKQPKTWSEADEIVERLRDPLAAAFNLTQEQRDSMTYNEAYMYGDTLFSRKFEGLDLYG